MFLWKVGRVVLAADRTCTPQGRALLDAIYWYLTCSLSFGIPAGLLAHSSAPHPWEGAF